MKGFLFSFLIGVLSLTALQAQVLEERYLFHDNTIREYLIYVPSTYSPEDAAPLIFVFHGLGADKENMLGTHFNSYAEQTGHIVIYPDALLSFLGTAWNSGTILNSNVDDVGFVLALIDTVSATYNINDRRIYACGFSMGGIMSNRLGCEQSEVFAAIGSVSGPFASGIRDNCVPSRHMPYIYVHGTGDGTVPYGGSPILGTSSAMSTMIRWASHNGCEAEATVEQVPDTADQEYHVERYSYTSCDEDAEVIHYRIDGWPHSWPLTGWNINATEEILNFFARHELPDETAVPTPVLEEESDRTILAGPNPFRETLHVFLNRHAGPGVLWTIWDSAGKRIAEGQGLGEIDTSNWSKGAYVIRFEGETGYTQKLIRF